MQAILYGIPDLVQLLLSYNADVNARMSSKGYIALHLAAEMARKEIMAILLDAGAKVDVHNVWGRTPLMIAVRNGHQANVKLLLEHGANASAKDYWGSTVLTIARQEGLGDREGMVQLLESHLLLQAKQQEQKSKKEGKDPDSRADDDGDDGHGMTTSTSISGLGTVSSSSSQKA